MRRLFKFGTLFVSTFMIIAADAEILLRGNRRSSFLKKYFNSTYVNSMLP